MIADRSDATSQRRAEAHADEAEGHAGRGDFVAAAAAAAAALELAPGLWKALVVAGYAERRLGRPEAAERRLREALLQFPDDDFTLRELAGALVDGGRAGEALALLPVPAARDAQGWFERGMLHDQDGDAESALAAAHRALRADGRHLEARFLVARSLWALGRIEEAADEYRRLTRLKPVSARAWFGLLDIKTIRLTAKELAELERTAAGARDGEERKLLAYALGRAYEDAGRMQAAMAAFDRANQRQRRDTPWHAETLTEAVATLSSRFAAPVPGEPTRGDRVIFVLGMPRSGTSLVEQVLAAHSRVIGGSELPEAGLILQEESRRRCQSYPAWLPDATEADWARLGEEYLSRTRRWQGRERFTDKTPENWLYLGPLLRMLPGARYLGCERDPLETAWSCYKQLFSPGHFAWSYDFDSLAAYARDQRILWRHFAALEPRRCRTVSYEGLVADFEPQVREILAFLGLEFETACLDFAAAQRELRTASAAQVRRPLDRGTARRARYGAVLAPLEAVLARAGLVPAVAGPA